MRQAMRCGLIGLLVLLCSAASAAAQVSINIGINVPVFPELVVVPAYPVYYAPRLDVNFFFYDGLFWVFQDDGWYVSSWYNGPWELVVPEVVPVYILRIPVRYYRHPPVYFREWRADAPPRWGEHWGHEWEQRRSGWDKWNRGSAPAPAPLPVYQRQYSGARYPRRVEQQQALQSQHYRYRPQDPVARQHYQQQGVKGAPVPAQRGQQQGEPQPRSPKQQAIQRATPPPPPQQGGPSVPRSESPQRGREGVQRSAPAQVPPQQPQQGTARHEQQTQKPHGQERGPQGKGAPQEPKQEPKHEPEQGQGQGQGQEKGQGHNK
jgi:hypothetical protein